MRGLLVRHLVLPEGLDGSREDPTFLAREVSPETHMNIMPQYWPAFRVREYPELARSIRLEKYSRVLDQARDLGLHILD